MSSAACTSGRRLDAARGHRGPRVLLLAGVGIARRAGSGGAEIISGRAFGNAESLNRGSWPLVDGHGGPVLDVVGSSLRAIDCGAVPLAIEWRPRPEIREHAIVLARLAAGPLGVSARGTPLGVRLARLPQPTRVLELAHLEHVAILAPGEPPPFPGASATLFPDAHLDDDDELQEQLARAVRAADVRFWIAESEAAAHAR